MEPRRIQLITLEAMIARAESLRECNPLEFIEAMEEAVEYAREQGVSFEDIRELRE